MRFTKIPEKTFEQLQINAGIIVTKFEPSTGKIPEEGKIVGATSGGVSFQATPEFSDYGEDIDNCPKNMKELKVLDNVEAKMSGSFASVSKETLALLIGAADINENKIVPRRDIADKDFTDVWWIGDYTDDNNDETGGFIAIHVMNALSTGGFKIQSSDKGKGKFDFEFTGHYSMAAQDTVPYEIYVNDGTGAMGLSAQTPVKVAKTDK